MSFLPQGLPQINVKILDCMLHLSACEDPLQQISVSHPIQCLNNITIQISMQLLCTE